jgi:hypothetical protein
MVVVGVVSGVFDDGCRLKYIAGKSPPEIITIPPQWQIAGNPM